MQVSELFRDPSFYRTFRARVVPVLRTYPLLKIWHAGCATGEEVYATAILLAEEGLYERAQIYATDLSPHALEQAKQGVYPASKLARVRRELRAAGGTRRASRATTRRRTTGIAIKESLRRNILFFQHDLVSDHVVRRDARRSSAATCSSTSTPTLRERVLAQVREQPVPGRLSLPGQQRTAAADDRPSELPRVRRRANASIASEVAEPMNACAKTERAAGRRRRGELVALEALLGDMDCELVCARSGNEALKQLLKREFAVMLLDVQMPEMDGYEVATYARENPATREVPIIFLTAMHEAKRTCCAATARARSTSCSSRSIRTCLRAKVRVFLELYIGRRKLSDEIVAHKQTLDDPGAGERRCATSRTRPRTTCEPRCGPRGFLEALSKRSATVWKGLRQYLSRSRKAARAHGRVARRPARLCASAEARGSGRGRLQRAPRASRDSDLRERIAAQHVALKVGTSHRDGDPDRLYTSSSSTWSATRSSSSAPTNPSVAVTAVTRDGRRLLRRGQRHRHRSRSTQQGSSTPSHVCTASSTRAAARPRDLPADRGAAPRANVGRIRAFKRLALLRRISAHVRKNREMNPYAIDT